MIGIIYIISKYYAITNIYHENLMIINNKLKVDKNQKTLKIKWKLGYFICFVHNFSYKQFPITILLVPSKHILKTYSSYPLCIYSSSLVMKCLPNYLILRRN